MIARVVTRRARPHRLRCDIVSLARAFVARHRALARSARAFARRRPFAPRLAGPLRLPAATWSRRRPASPRGARARHDRGRISGIRC